ncbi:MAG: hypothetical protein KKE08_07295 [Gammaproteobacteria bacterium]|nr:hypothetical protein [Gammaproteobacteria bacterium]MBU2070822.1 hypothetical protein [Gammaproteobacteria bacterium]MBU2182813.1 hypothetical protein [Gammaproteobacteria bacterium]MBU2205945.1 hypothetical protein [Gammaproteobacteria bacterium]
MKHTYQDRLCLFLDILGFSALVKGQDCDVVHKVIRRIKLELRSSKEYMEKIGSSPIAATFSDCIVLSIEVNNEDVAEASNILVTATVKMLQDTYLNQAIALRGGMAYGKLYHKADGVFGPAMIKAYELESQYADWPRVVFDRSVMEHLKGENGLSSIGFTNYGDGFCGVDCLTRIEDVLNIERLYLFQRDSGMEHLEKLQKMNTITLAKLEEHYGNPKVYSKYLKLNARIRSLLKRFDQLPAYLDRLD